MFNTNIHMFQFYLRAAVCLLNSLLTVFPLQENEEEEEEDAEEDSVSRRRCIQESLSLPGPICYPRNAQRDNTPEAAERSRSKLKLSSSPSLPPSQRDSVESGGSPSLSSSKDTSLPSPHSPSGFLRNVKKRESKGKGKELKGTAVNLLPTICCLHSTFTKQVVAATSTNCHHSDMPLTGSLLVAVHYFVKKKKKMDSVTDETNESSSVGKPKKTIFG